jgi:hypothetical protein
MLTASGNDINTEKANSAISRRRAIVYCDASDAFRW